jgi:hypothetical protein
MYNDMYSHSVSYRTVLLPGHWWFMPIILATQEAEVRRLKV